MGRDVRFMLFAYFGSFSKTLLTMFEVTFGNWVVSTRLLFENVHEGYGAFFVLYRCMVCFAVVKVIAAVFITETGRIVSQDDDFVMLQKRRAAQVYEQKLGEMFSSLDVTHDGFLSWAEFQGLLQDDLMRDWAQSLDIDT